MNTATKQLVKAARSVVATGDERTLHMAIDNLRTVLNACEEQQGDPVRKLVLRDALGEYASAQHVEARNLREGKGILKSWDKETAERFAQGCDARAAVARAMFLEACEA